MMADSSLVELFGKFSDSLKALKNQTASGGDSGSSSDLSAIWNHIDNCMKYVSQQSTKLSLACESPPYPTPEEILPVLRNIETAVINLVSSCLSLHPSIHGSTLKSFLVGSVDSVVEDVVELLGNLSESCSKKRKKYLQSTGHVWQITDKFSSLPKNNKEAVLMKLKEISQLLQDAHQEFDEAIKECTNDGRGKEYDVIDELDDDMDDFYLRWKTNELDMASAALGIVKTCRVCLSKITKAIDLNGSINPSTIADDDNQLQQDLSSTEEILARLSISEEKVVANGASFSSPVVQLDVVLEVAEKISPHVDDLVASLYPPLAEVDTTRNNVHKINQLLRDFLQIARSSHFIVPSTDSTWLDFLSSAVSHNTDKTLKALETFEQS